MLEPLIVLTVLNCFFMFSSTVTTCALWWQYRSHRCCFRRDPAGHAFSKMKSTSAKATKKSEKTKPENASENGNGNNREKSSSMMHRDIKSRRSSKQKARSKKLLQEIAKSVDRLSSRDTMDSWEIENNAGISEDNTRMSEDTARMSEASQTANEAKSAVVMEYSTVQKIVQILDDTTDLNATKLAIRDFNARHNSERKTAHDFSIEPKNEPRMPVYTTLPQT
ncbi:uncharacterized protein LOC116431498 [Nomia melanderi]|uniref:uncharacterized protein LOC116431498 n=1 Tax=Nomia melanderi TaxID=2448451 RepID=UPI00130470A6|nr:uncharacterized protein LOC116431498 [Nomia melanderi]